MVSKFQQLHIVVVDDDMGSHEAILDVLGEPSDFKVDGYQSVESFKQGFKSSGGPTCIILNVSVGPTCGMKLLRSMARDGLAHPVIMTCKDHSVPLIVEAMRNGASDFLAKPICPNLLKDAVQGALATSRKSAKTGTPALDSLDDEIADVVNNLAPRKRETLEQLLKGDSEKQIAFKLSISHHTVHSYVKSLYKQFDVCSRAELLAKCLNR